MALREGRYSLGRHSRGHIAVVQALLEAGAAIDIKDVVSVKSCRIHCIMQSENLSTSHYVVDFVDQAACLSIFIDYYFTEREKLQFFALFQSLVSLSCFGFCFKTKLLMILCDCHHQRISKIFICFF